METTTTLTARQRVFSALEGSPVDKKPAISVCQHATYQLMEQTGAFWPGAHSSPGQMAALSAAGFHVLGLDAVRAPYCQTVEAEALGAEIKSGNETHLPSIHLHPCRIGQSPAFPSDFLERGRIPAVLGAVELLRRELGGKAAVMGGVCGPFSIAASLLGIPVLLKTAYRTPSEVEPFLELGLRAGIALAGAMVEAGADIIVVEDMMASMDMISPKIYRSVVAAYERALIEAIPAPTILHICGKLDAVMVDIAGTGATAISVESAVDIPAARRNLAAAGLTTRIIGAVHPIQVLLNGTVQQVEQAVEQAVADGVDLVSPGCAVAPATPRENLIAMVDAAHGA